MASVPKYVLLTDAPPLLEGGFGCHVLSWNWLHALQANVRLVVTRRLTRSLSLHRILAGISAPVVFYPDLSRVRGLGRLTAVRSSLEVLLFLLWLPRIRRAIKASGAERVFAFFGGNSWFLFVARFLASATGLPLDLYLVEDLEESTRIHNQRMVARMARWYEPRLLRRAARVFTISPGFADHLTAKYGIKASWLPVTVFSKAVEYHPFQPAQPDVRCLAFIGAVNRPNADALRDVLRAVELWNSGAPRFQLRLLVMTYAPPAYIRNVLGASPFLEVLIQPERARMEERLRDSWAVLVPYSFLPEMRTMVSTAFPTKLTDSLPTGRPVLAYCPLYSSVSRYFREQGLPLCAHSADELNAALKEIELCDNDALIVQYRTIIERFHSPQFLRETLSQTS